MRNLNRFHEAVSSFDALLEKSDYNGNPWHDKDGHFGKVGDASWSKSCDPNSGRSKKYPCAKKENKQGKMVKQDSEQSGTAKFKGGDRKGKEAGIGATCGSHARGQGKDIRCHDMQDMKLTKKARKKNPNAKPVIRGFMDKHG
jgi:hypothetical protein